MGDMGQTDGGFLTIYQALVVTRWLHFAATFMLFGSAFFWFYMGNGFPRAHHATENLLRAAGGVTAITGVGWLYEIVANMTGGFGAALDPDNLRLFFYQTQFGPVAILRLVLLAAALIVAALPWRNRAWLSAQLHIGALLLIDQAWFGHAAEGGAGLWGALMITVYCIHVLAAGAWLGGLPPLLFTLHELRGVGAAEAHGRSLAVLSRYSAMGMVAVVLIVVTGIINAGFRTGFAPRSVVWGDYGMVLAAKATLVGAMLVLAYFNRFIAMPRLRAASTNGAAQAASLRGSVTFELFLGMLVLGAAAVLGITPPPN